MPWLFFLLSSDYCADRDGDGFYAQAGCGTPVDCDDNDSNIHPGADEICNDGIDNDCDGIVDELRCVVPVKRISKTF
jgi:bacillopeptidase F